MPLIAALSYPATIRHRTKLQKIGTDFSVTKMALATEELYQHYWRTKKNYRG